MSCYYFIHVDHEIVKYVATEEKDYEEVIEEYEEIFVPEEFQEPPATLCKSGNIIPVG
jgi:hypothetical protein